MSQLYGSGGVAAGAGTVATLAYTGGNIGWMLVAGFTILFAGLALYRLGKRPKRR